MLVGKKGQQFELDRSNWCTHQNFRMMYEMISEKLIEAGLAKRLDVPVWKTREGVTVSDDKNDKAFGCKVKIEITHPEMVIVADEVGCNTSQTGDGHVGGETYMCDKNKIPQKIASKKNKRFTLLGLTLLTGEPLSKVLFSPVRRTRTWWDLALTLSVRK